MTTIENITVTGTKAIELAERLGLRLSKYADPTEGAREGLTVAEARDIAAEDPSLIYVQVPADLAETDAQRAREITSDSFSRSGPWARRSRD